MRSAEGKHWCFTWNNYDDVSLDVIAIVSQNDAVSYVCYGKEVGENGTPHLQGFISFKRKKRFNAVKALLGARVHLERARAEPSVAVAYCRKDGDFTEYGTCPVSQQGRRSDIDAFVSWVEGLPCRPTDSDIARAHPGCFLRYGRRCRELSEAFHPNQAVRTGDPRGWQCDLSDLLRTDADDRMINFYVDIHGNTGKSWFCGWALSSIPGVQVLSVGKRDDLCYAIDETKWIFLIDVPRLQMEFLRYEVLEMIKNRLIFSPKYQSSVKALARSAHVVVFSNEHPSMNALSDDRYNVIEL